MWTAQLIEERDSVSPKNHVNWGMMARGQLVEMLNIYCMCLSLSCFPVDIHQSYCKTEQRVWRKQDRKLWNLNHDAIPRGSCQFAPSQWTLFWQKSEKMQWLKENTGSVMSLLQINATNAQSKEAEPREASGGLLCVLPHPVSQSETWGGTCWRQSCCSPPPAASS